MKKNAVIQSQSMVSMNSPQNGITTGGTQRYTVQLAKLLRQKGYQVTIIARAGVPCADFEIEEGRIIVVQASLNRKGDYKYSKFIYDYCESNNADFVCYVDLMVAKYYCYPNSITLQHGIGWDGPLNLLQRVKRYITTRKYINVSRKFEHIICVDTNYINWARENDKRFFGNPGKYIYLPNFADESVFEYSYEEWNKDIEFVLLYPRRLVEYRGYDLFINMCEILKSKGYNIHPVLAFEENASDNYTGLFENKKCNYEIIHPKLNEIASEYHRAFLTYVPTIWSEGTSLSAIEAICSGCPVISSDVGGLGNIIIPGFNGDIVAPTVDSFVKATEKVLANPQLRNEWAKNCELVKKSFLIKRWNEKMLEFIE